MTTGWAEGEIRQSAGYRLLKEEKRSGWLAGMKNTGKSSAGWRSQRLRGSSMVPRESGGDLGARAGSVLLLEIPQREVAKHSPGWVHPR